MISCDVNILSLLVGSPLLLQIKKHISYTYIFPSPLPPPSWTVPLPTLSCDIPIIPYPYIHLNICILPHTYLLVLDGRDVDLDQVLEHGEGPQGRLGRVVEGVAAVDVFYFCVGGSGLVVMGV